MKKRVIRLFVLGLCLLIGLATATPVPAAAAKTSAKKTTKTTAKTAKTSSSSLQNVTTWGKQYDFQSYWVKKNKTMRITGNGNVADLTADLRSIRINGVTVWIGEPVKIQNGKVYMTQQDIQTSLQAIFKPTGQKKPRVVVLDPGHGGTQPGAIAKGKKEKEYVLLIAKEVKRKLEASGVKVVLTRTGDQTLGLSARPEVAKRAKADLFVSIHLNAAASTSANGVEVFTVTPTGAQSTSVDRNGSREYTSGNRYDVQNARLAYLIQKEILRATNMSDRGVRRDRLAVLTSSTVPSVLVEAGFITNPKDQYKIFTQTERNKIAAAIAKGILNYGNK